MEMPLTSVVVILTPEVGVVAPASRRSRTLPLDHRYLSVHCQSEIGHAVKPVSQGLEFLRKDHSIHGVAGGLKLT